MKKFAIAAVALFVVGCAGAKVGGGAMPAAPSACDMACDEAKKSCIDECGNAEVAEGEETPEAQKAACELGCNEARDKCAEECKEK